MGEPPLQKLSISGPTLASIIQRFASSPGDVDGFLFGHITRLPPPDLHDDDTPIAAAAETPLAASITGHFCSGAPMSFYDPLGRVDHRSLRRNNLSSNTSLLGWFSGRRHTPLRPSMREFAVSHSLSKSLTLTLEDDPLNPPSESPDLSLTPCIFLLLSSSSTPNQSVHTHEYRAFVFRSANGGVLESRSLDVVNVGPAFRGQYSSFSPESAFPWMPCRVRGFDERDAESKSDESLKFTQRCAKEQRLLDSSVEGFELERLGRLVGPGASMYTAEFEDLYGRMLLKLEGLARLVEKSTATVIEQEIRNLKLRSKIARLE